MAITIFVNVYQIDANVLPRNAPVRMGFPTADIIVQDITSSPTRSLSSGYNVYGLITVPSSAAANSAGTRYYVAETGAQLATLISA